MENLSTDTSLPLYLSPELEHSLLLWRHKDSEGFYTTLKVLGNLTGEDRKRKRGIVSNTSINNSTNNSYSYSQSSACAPGGSESSNGAAGINGSKDYVDFRVVLRACAALEKHSCKSISLFYLNTVRIMCPIYISFI